MTLRSDNVPPEPLPEDGAQGRDARRFVTALARGLHILEAFDNERELGIQELAETTGLPVTTVSRLTYTLAELGYLRASRSGRYLPGAGFLGLSASINRNLGMQRIARPHLDKLARELDCTAIVGMRDRHSMVFLEVARPPHSALVVNTDAGSHLPIVSTAVGLAYLAAAPVAERAHLLETLRAKTPDWPTVRERIEKAHASYRRKGFVIQERSASREVNAVAAPLVSDHANTVYCFMCGGPSSTTTRRRLHDEVGPRLVQVVHDIGEELAHRPLQRLPKAPL